MMMDDPLENRQTSKTDTVSALSRSSSARAEGNRPKQMVIVGGLYLLILCGGLWGVSSVIIATFWEDGAGVFQERDVLESTETQAAPAAAPSVSEPPMTAPETDPAKDEERPDDPALSEKATKEIKTALDHLTPLLGDNFDQVAMGPELLVAHHHPLADSFMAQFFSGDIAFSTLVFLKAESRQRLEKAYKAGKNAKAVAVHGKGNWAYFTGQTSPEEAARRALQRCELGAQSPCVLFALNDRQRLTLNFMAEMTPPTQYRTTGSFQAKEVPFVRDAAQVKLENYAQGATPKAIALTHSGYYYYITGYKGDSTVVETVLARCREKKQDACFLYAKDNDIVMEAQ